MTKSRKIISIIICIFVIFIVLVFIKIKFHNKQVDEFIPHSESRIDFLWYNTIHKMLQDPLWRERNAYDTGHFLMIPMHIVFLKRDENKINHFQDFFERFAENYKQDDFNSLDTLTRLHFLYLVSQYLTLNKTYNETELQELADIVIGELKDIWEQSA